MSHGVGRWEHFRVSFVVLLQFAMEWQQLNKQPKFNEIKCTGGIASLQLETEARTGSKQRKPNLKSALGKGKQPFVSLIQLLLTFV